MQQFAEPPQEPSQSFRSRFSDPSQSPLWWNSRLGRAVRLLLLAFGVCIVWLTLENRWGGNFQLPTRYEVDAHYVLGMMKLAQQGDLGLFGHIKTESLGAPFIGQLNDFPQSERAIVWLGGQIARFTGLIPAANTLLILSCLIGAFSFYLASRLWRISRTFSWIFAIVYAFLPHTERSISHLGVIFSGILPLQFYVLWYIVTAQKLSLNSFRFQLSILIGLCSGFLNIYWLFIFIQLYFIALICRFLRRRGYFIQALIPVSAACFSAVLLLGSFIIYKVEYGENSSALVRSYHYVEAWSLKPIDLFLPGPGKFLGPLSNYLARYYDGGAFDIGEGFRSYIGICAIVGVLFLLFRGTQRQLTGHSASLPYLLAVWIIAYISFGGIHSAFSLVFDFYNIRGTTRYSTAIATIGLLYFVFVGQRLTRSWFPTLRLALLVGISVFAIAEQSARSYRQAYIYFPPNERGKLVAADRDLALALESTLERGSMLYLLPAMDFPEPARASAEFDNYQAMRPFLYSTKLRYSYGSHKGRQGADWQLDVQGLPATEMATALESYGFAGILLNRKGYEDRGEALLAELAEAGWPMAFEQGIDNEWVFIRLTPAEEPVLPTLTPYAVTFSR